MSTKIKEKAAIKPTNRRFSSVEEMMRRDGYSDEVQEKYKEMTKATTIVTQLAKLRQKAGVTQEQMAKYL